MDAVTQNDIGPLVLQPPKPLRLSTMLVVSNGIVLIESSEDGGIDLDVRLESSRPRSTHLDRLQVRALLDVLGAAVYGG